MKTARFLLSSLLTLFFISLTGGESISQAADAVSFGPRPLFLVEDMEAEELKEKLLQCQSQPAKTSNFSIGHRGAALQFPEHTRESYLAAARMGAGIIECDVTFTKDKALVCRHSQCDLHLTTDILDRPELAAKCSAPFSPASENGGKALVKCCASDLTLAEFKSLNGKMDGGNEKAETIAEYVKGTPGWRTDLYASNGTLMTHQESITLIDALGLKFTPELKSADVSMPYNGNYSQQDYATAMIAGYKAAGIDPARVFPQSFNLDDVLYWIENESEFGAQAVFLDGRYRGNSLNPADPDTFSPSMQELADKGLSYIAPPIWMLLALDETGQIVPSAYAKEAKKAGLNIITWTLERSGSLTNGGGWYYRTVTDAIDNEGDVMTVLDVLAKDVGVVGVFSDWPATTTYYANCMGLD
ncbi:glycerophosphodiester phosphodiesterase family protein [Sneathiella sp.]|uniref:glycerophosphodiester phosphodiesterase family protein n=1 Tax=Sneathiella sp. TaxID=1964365 RepID=UPI0026194355|nr:glycerophosphodiester phosphodiesterase family protein [Sneathiella sp.]MDF2365849.1 glycerophosphodiester phosphodiesterase family protein [Sneathiella sp.]